MTRIRRFDHVGITVADLEGATDFFVGLGLEVEGRATVEGEFLDTVCGIPDSRCEVVMLRVPGDTGTTIEVCTFVHPDLMPGQPEAMANVPGLRNICFQVEDLREVVDRLATEGYGLVGGIGHMEGAWDMCYVRGPEGIVVALAQALG